MRYLFLVCLFLLGACPNPPHPKPKDAVPPPSTSDATPAPASVGTVVTVTSANPTTVYVSFGADSIINASSWSSFCVGGGLVCNFPLTGSMVLPNPQGQYLNMTLAFGTPVECGATKAEVNVNNSSWYDVLDISLVDGFSNPVEIRYTPPTADANSSVILGPPNGKDGNEKVLGVYPYGCDICVARQNPPCGIPVGKDGCKGGTQYDPDVACQYQGAVKGGGGAVEVVLLPGIPASP